MIGGTLVLEDTILHFQFDKEVGSVALTVTDAHSGTSGFQMVDGKTFACALAIALNPEGEAVPMPATAEEWEELAEAVTPRLPEDPNPKTGPRILRWIP